MQLNIHFLFIFLWNSNEFTDQTNICITYLICSLTVHTLSACSPCMSICAWVLYLECVRMCAALFFNTHEHTRRRRRCRRRCSAGLFCFLERASSGENFSCSLEVRSTSPALERAEIKRKIWKWKCWKSLSNSKVKEVEKDSN